MCEADHVIQRDGTRAIGSSLKMVVWEMRVSRRMALSLSAVPMVNKVGHTTPPPAGPRLINTSVLLPVVQMVFGRDGLWRRRVHIPVSLCVTVTTSVLVRFVQAVSCVVMVVWVGRQ